MEDTKRNSMEKTTLIVMLILLLSRLLGFVREMIVAKVFGSGDVTDAFYSAFAIPDLMYDLLVAGALSSGFMPVFASYLADGDEDGAWKAANTFITVTLIFIIIFNLFGITFTKYLIPIVAAGSMKNPTKYQLTIKLTRIMFSGVTFTVLAGLSKGVLESYKKFFAPAFGPVLYNVGIIFGAIVFSKMMHIGITGMAIGVIIGAFFNFFVQFPSFMKVGKRFAFKLDIHNEGFKKMLYLMAPALIALSVNRLNTFINLNAASFLNAGSTTDLRYAQRIMMVPVGIFGAAILTTIFPTMNLEIAENKIEDYKDTLSIGLRSVFFITIPCAVGLIVLNKPIMRLLFRNGRFTENDVNIAAFALAFYSIGVIGNSVVPIVIRAFYSNKDTKTPLYIGIIIVIINAILNYSFIKFSNLAVGGIAFTSAVTSCIEFLLLYKILSKKMNGLRTKELLRCFIKGSISALIMGGAAFSVSKLIERRIGYGTKLLQLTNVGASIIIACIVYFISAYILKMPELNVILDSVKSKIKK